MRMGDISSSVCSAPSCPVVVSSALLEAGKGTEVQSEPRSPNAGDKIAATDQKLGTPTDPSPPLRDLQPPSVSCARSQLAEQEPKQHTLGTNARQIQPSQHQQIPYAHYPPQLPGVAYTAAVRQTLASTPSVLQHPTLIHSHSAPAALQQSHHLQSNSAVFGYNVPPQPSTYASASGATFFSVPTHPRIAGAAEYLPVGYRDGTYPHIYYAAYAQPCGIHYTAHQFSGYPSYPIAYSVPAPYSSPTSSRSSQVSTSVPTQSRMAIPQEQRYLYPMNSQIEPRGQRKLSKPHIEAQETIVPLPHLRRHSHPARISRNIKRRSSSDYIPGTSGWNRPGIRFSGAYAEAVGTTGGQSASDGSIVSLPLGYPRFGGNTVRMTTSTQGTQTSNDNQQKNKLPILSSPPLLPSISPQTFTSLLPRGPPRKPRQSGYALWVGNLPLGTTVVELKDHFSTNFMNEIESVFLITKSNCAFVNYKSEESVQEAIRAFHDQRYKGVRLVCRLRRGWASGAARCDEAAMDPQADGKDDPEIRGKEDLNEALSQTGEKTPTATVDSQSKELGVEKPMKEVEGNLKAAHEAHITCSTLTASTMESNNRSTDLERQRDRIFIVKSLTVEDLDLSVKNGIWATQSHNEEVLNRAFETSENVYLIFSANKSGEYYGYARMASRIEDIARTDCLVTTPTSKKENPGDDEISGLNSRQKEIPEDTSAASAATMSPAKVRSQDHSQFSQDQPPSQTPVFFLPRTIFTPETSTAPPGRIIDDSARGTIFWEAFEGHETENASNSNFTEDDAAIDGAGEGENVSQSWGRPFKLEWISTTRVPFYKTKGLRNAWNGNREVKIARDGTEVETLVGKRLMALFGRGDENVGRNTVGTGEGGSGDPA